MPEVIKNYDHEKYNFSSMILRLFEGANSLEQLHLVLPPEESYGIVNFENDNETWFHKVFYHKLNKGWKEFEMMYNNFISDTVVSVMGHSDFVFQAKPTFRVQVPNNKSVGEYHRDYDYNHQLGEINIVLALTDMKDSSAIWIESVPGLGDYHPMNMCKGQFAVFNGNTCTHGNKLNDTGNTRVSMDFRILPKKYYDPDFHKASTSKGIPMVVGGYYSENR